MAEAADHIISQMTLVDWLDDLTVRFLLNLPPAELSSVPRLCFQVEEAQWFYEDFIRPANPSLPSLNLRQFCLTLFQHCPLLSGFNSAQHLAAYEEFLAYKVRVPVRGAILMDDNMDKVLLVRGWKKGASWSFPRGKINKDEPDIDCAIREVYEETGFDVGAAGLVERNMIGDGKVKAIDVTMREQHMKLFVFRGVALDTHFETKTRKEIGKIQWYNVKDLPGFKKVKGMAGHGQGEAESIKFYMVAPFLGHLKKWIGEQRRKDSRAAAQVQHGRNISLSNEGVQATIAEDEAEDTGLGFATDNGPSVDRSADELKRLLSIGGPAVPTSQPTNSVQSSNDIQTNSLLAMLQGNIVAPVGTSLPHTPYEQIDPFIPIQEPHTPQPQHPRHASAAAAHSQYSPQTLQQGLQQQQSQRHSSMLIHSFAGQLNYQQPGTSHVSPHSQQQIFEQQQRQQSLPTGLFPGPGSTAHAGQRPGSSGLQQQLPPHLQAMPNQGSPAFTKGMRQQRPLSGPVPVGANMPIVSEKAAPDANKLPPPILDAHSMKLLDAFKTGPRTSKSGSPSNETGQPPGSQHQTALLDLFRKPSAATVSPLSPVSGQKTAPVAPASPALTDATEVPAAARNVERRPTLNEITRTLPLKSKVVSPMIPAASQSRRTQNALPHEEEQPHEVIRTPQARPNRVAPESLQPTSPRDMQAERPKSRGQLFDASQPKKLLRASPQVKQIEAAPARSRSQQAGRLPKSPKPASQSVSIKAAARVPATASPKPKNKQARNENGQPRPPQPVPQFSILQRPGSSRTSAPLSPLPNEPVSAANPPQVLRRPREEPADTPNKAQRQSSVIRTPVEGDKKDQLLALFGKTTQSNAAPASAHAPPALEIRSPELMAPEKESQQKSSLLDLFQGNHAEVTIRTPEPPPSPKLAPERNPSAQGTRTQSSQLDLLKLFTKPSATGPNRVNSPGTPISPFTLGTPATNMSLESLPSAAYNNATSRSPEPRSRLGSMASVMSNGTRTGVKSGSQTPTEHKDLLLGYLNGVVRSEGYRGAKKPT